MARNTPLLLLLLFTAACYHGPVFCNKEPRVFILTIPEGLGKYGRHLPKCSYDDPAVWQKHTNVVTDSGQDGYKVVPHYTMQYSGPWYFHNALAASQYTTDSMTKADLIYVDWHCYYLRFWSLYYREHQKAEAAKFMRAALAAIKASDAWKVNNGTNFVFYLQCPTLSWLLNDCDLNGMIVSHERAMMCDINGMLTMNSPHTVIAPYSSTTGATPYVAKIRVRGVLLFFTAACQGPKGENEKVGKKMRRVFVQALNNEALKQSVSPHAVEVQCSCHHCSTRIAHDRQMAKLRRSVFCLVLPGDTQSSRRITEVMLSGCIPVFVLSPLHTLPMAEVVDYERFSLFFRLSDTSAWIHPLHAEFKRWQPDTVVKSAIDVKTIAEMLPILSNLVKNDLDKLHWMQQEQLKYRSYFRFTGMFRDASGETGPEDAVMDAIVKRYANSIKTTAS